MTQPVWSWWCFASQATTSATTTRCPRPSSPPTTTTSEKLRSESKFRQEWECTRWDSIAGSASWRIQPFWRNLVPESNRSSRKSLEPISQLSGKACWIWVLSLSLSQPLSLSLSLSLVSSPPSEKVIPQNSLPVLSTRENKVHLFCCKVVLSRSSQ